MTSGRDYFLKRLAEIEATPSNARPRWSQADVTALRDVFSSGAASTAAFSRRTFDWKYFPDGDSVAGYQNVGGRKTALFRWTATPRRVRCCSECGQLMPDWCWTAVDHTWRLHASCGWLAG